MQCLDRLLIDKAVRKLTTLLALDQSGFFQLFYMVGNGGEGQVKLLSDVAHGTGTSRPIARQFVPSKALEDGQTIFVGECFQELDGVVHGAGNFDISKTIEIRTWLWQVVKRQLLDFRT